MSKRALLGLKNAPNYSHNIPQINDQIKINANPLRTLHVSLIHPHTPAVGKRRTNTRSTLSVHRGIRSTFGPSLELLWGASSRTRLFIITTPPICAFRGWTAGTPKTYLYSHVWYDKCFIIIKIIFVKLFRRSFCESRYRPGRILTGWRLWCVSGVCTFLKDLEKPTARVQCDSFALLPPSFQDDYDDDDARIICVFRVRTTTPGNKIISRKKQIMIVKIDDKQPRYGLNRVSAPVGRLEGKKEGALSLGANYVLGVFLSARAYTQHPAAQKTTTMRMTMIYRQRQNGCCCCCYHRRTECVVWQPFCSSRWNQETTLTNMVPLMLLLLQDGAKEIFLWKLWDNLYCCMCVRLFPFFPFYGTLLSGMLAGWSGSLWTLV